MMITTYRLNKICSFGSLIKRTSCMSVTMLQLVLWQVFTAFSDDGGGGVQNRNSTRCGGDGVMRNN